MNDIYNEFTGELLLFDTVEDLKKFRKLFYETLEEDPLFPYQSQISIIDILIDKFYDKYGRYPFDYDPSDPDAMTHFIELFVKLK